mmetsp:Transcript_58999/g.149765  ORF Transcript_58999/g.149765 Transcript_58999/m.149765 type:complete len:205 (+) Transcript_58999:876-1490(+)
MAWREALRAPAPRSECEVCRATPSATRRQGAAWPTEGFAVLPQFHSRHQAGRPGGHAAVAALLGWQCLFGLLPRSRLRSPLGGVGLVHGELLGRGLWPAAAAAHGRGAGRRGPRHRGPRVSDPLLRRRGAARRHRRGAGRERVSGGRGIRVLGRRLARDLAPRRRGSRCDAPPHRGTRRGGRPPALAGLCAGAGRRGDEGEVGT